MSDAKLVEQLRERFNSGEKLKYVFFWGHQPGRNGVTAACFSQWYEAPFTIGDNRYLTAEHFMMAEKAALFGDHEIRLEVLSAPNPGAAKALGRKVRNFNEELWIKHRYSIVVRANKEKFAQNPELGAFLIQTGSRILVEASPVDSIWGIGMAADDKDVDNPNFWRGLNLLGFALMDVRSNMDTPSNSSLNPDPQQELAAPRQVLRPC